MIPASFVLGLFTRIVSTALLSECGRPNGPGTLSGVVRMAIDRGAAFHRRQIHGTCTVSMLDAGRIFVATLPTAFLNLLRVDPKLPAHTDAGTMPWAGPARRFISFVHNKHKNKSQGVPAILSPTWTQ